MTMKVNWRFFWLDNFFSKIHITRILIRISDFFGKKFTSLLYMVNIVAKFKFCEGALQNRRRGSPFIAKSVWISSKMKVS